MAWIGGVESGRSAFIKVSMSRVRDVDVGAGTVVVEVHGVGGADGQVVGASMGKDVEVCPGLVWSARGRALENLL